MSTKRYQDPAGLLQDRVHIQFNGDPDDIKNLRASLEAATPVARIARLQQHPALRAKADALAAELKDGEADLMTLLKITQAEGAARYLAAAPHVISDRKTQKQRSKAGFSSGKERRDAHSPSWKRWQAEALAIYERNPHLSKSEICRRVGAKFGKTRQAISNRIRLP